MNAIRFVVLVACSVLCSRSVSYLGQRLANMFMLSKIKLPLMLIVGLLIVLSMLRLGVWQLDRAEQKQLILSQLQAKSEQAHTDLLAISKNIQLERQRFRNVSAAGVYDADKSIYIDNQVVNGQVGYQIFTPLILTPGQAILVARGWLPVGSSRDVLPVFETPLESQALIGRLNLPPAQPPLWDESYNVYNGAVWQYLPISEYAQQMQLNVLPLVLELAPEQTAESDESKSPFVREWSAVNDEWVAKHKGYAFQWFAMAVAFFIACLVLLIRKVSTHNAS